MNKEGYKEQTFRLDKRIKDLREERGYTVNKLANRAGVSQSYLRDIELGNKNPTVNFISLLCESLNLTLKEFFDDGSEPKTQSDPLLENICQLSPDQRSNLLAFLKSINSK